MSKWHDLERMKRLIFSAAQLVQEPARVPRGELPGDRLERMYEPTPEEIDLFAGQYPPEQTLAVLTLAKRLGIAPILARAMLQRAMAGTCTFDGCDRPVQARGLCPGHYQQQRRGEDPKPLGTAKGESVLEIVNFKAQPDLIEGAKRDADREGIEPSEWWRRAGRERLDRRKK